MMAKKKKTVTAPAAEVKADTTDKKADNKTVKTAPVVAEKPAKKSAAATTIEKKTTKKATETKSASKTAKTTTAAKATKEVKAEEVVKAHKAEKATKSTKTTKPAKATKAAPSDAVKVQFGVDEYDVESIKKAVEADFRSKYTGHYKNVQIYIKPEEKTAYYVVNSKFSDKITL